MTGKAPIKVRWVDVNKGDDKEPNYRSRLVAMEFKRGVNAEWFSGTPPLEALRTLCSWWASQEGDGGLLKGRGGSVSEDLCMLVVDVRKAHLCAPATRDVFIEPPKEDKEEGEEDMCGQLQYSMYGTRDAAKNWSMEVERAMGGVRV